MAAFKRGGPSGPGGLARLGAAASWAGRRDLLGLGLGLHGAPRRFPRGTLSHAALPLPPWLLRRVNAFLATLGFECRVGSAVALSSLELSLWN